MTFEDMIFCTTNINNDKKYKNISKEYKNIIIFKNIRNNNKEYKKRI